MEPVHQHPSIIILYLHGGGYLWGSPKTHRSFLSYLSVITNSRIYTPDYRLAPECPFPAAIEDAEAAYQWLLAQYKPEQIIIAGDSSGGGLALATLINLKNLAKALPLAGIVISPWTDLALTGDSLRTNAESDRLIPVKSLPFIVQNYLGKVDRFNPLASPLYGNLKGLPSLYILASSSEVLYSDACRFTTRARACDVDVTFDVWEDAIHAWPFCAAFLPEGRQAIQRIASFIRKKHKPI